MNEMTMQQIGLGIEILLKRVAHFGLIIIIIIITISEWQ